MKSTSSKENILKKIRQALAHPVPVPFPKSEGNNSVFLQPADDLEVEFANEFTRLLGKFAFCVNEKDLQFQLKQLFLEKKWKNIYCVEDNLVQSITGLTAEKINQSTLYDCDASVTSCEYLIARTGSIVMSSALQLKNYMSRTLQLSLVKQFTFTMLPYSNFCKMKDGLNMSYVM